MLTTSDLLVMNNDQLYNEYLKALEDRSLPLINTIRNIISDRYSIRELKKSPLDEPFKNPDIARFFDAKQ